MGQFDTEAAVRHLRDRDPKLRPVIESVGPCRLRPVGGRFGLLVRSVLSQQISVVAARTIRRNLQSKISGGRISAGALETLSDSDLQDCGISRQKRTYLRHLVQCTRDGTVNFRRLARLPDEQVIEQLIRIKGVGRWTAQMFLIFGLGRPDVFPPDDLGIQGAMKRVYSMEKPSRERLNDVASNWKPWRSVACWYLWRSLDNA